MKSIIEIDNKIYSYNLNTVDGDLKLYGKNIFGSTNIGNSIFSYSLYLSIEKTYGCQGPYIAEIITKKNTYYYVYNNIDNEFDHKADKFFNDFESSIKYFKLIYNKEPVLKKNIPLITDSKILLPKKLSPLLLFKSYPYYIFHWLIYLFALFFVFISLSTYNYKEQILKKTQYFNNLSQKIDKRFNNHNWTFDSFITTSYKRCLNTFENWKSVDNSSDWKMKNYECNQFNSIAQWDNNNNNKIPFDKIAKHYKINNLSNSTKSFKNYKITKNIKKHILPSKTNVVVTDISTYLNKMKKLKKIESFQIFPNASMKNFSFNKHTETNKLFEKYDNNYTHLRIKSHKNIIETIRTINNISKLSLIRNLQINKNQSLYNITVDIYIHTSGN